MTELRDGRIAGLFFKDDFIEWQNALRFTADDKGIRFLFDINQSDFLEIFASRDWGEIRRAAKARRDDILAACRRAHAELEPSHKANIEVTVRSKHFQG